MYHEEQKAAAGVTLSPKASFILGLVGGMLVLCTIGFFILLSMVLGGGGVNLGKGGDSYAVAPSPSPSAPLPDDGGAAPAVGEVKAIDKTDHVTGATNAVVTLYEWSDFQCPFCQRFHPTMEQLMADPAYKGKLKWVYRHFPLSFHPNAMPAANAAECASEQGKFWEYAGELFAGQDSLSDAFYGQLADKLKLNRSKFDSCYSAKKYQAKITADQTAGTTAGITGTPGTIIVGKDGSKQLVPGAVPIEQLKAMVDQALQYTSNEKRPVPERGPAFRFQAVATSHVPGSSRLAPSGMAPSSRRVRCPSGTASARSSMMTKARKLRSVSSTP